MKCRVSNVTVLPYSNPTVGTGSFPVRKTGVCSCGGSEHSNHYCVAHSKLILMYAT